MQALPARARNIESPLNRGPGLPSPGPHPSSPLLPLRGRHHWHRRRRRRPRDTGPGCPKNSLPRGSRPLFRGRRRSRIDTAAQAASSAARARTPGPPETGRGRRTTFSLPLGLICLLPASAERRTPTRRRRGVFRPPPPRVAHVSPFRAACCVSPGKGRQEEAHNPFP